MNRLRMDPLIRNEIDGVVERLELMGYDDREIAEYMGFSLKKLFKRVGKGFQKVGNLVTGGSGGGDGYTVTTPKGTVAIGPQGLNITQSPQSLPVSSVKSATSLKIEEGLKNPKTMMMVAGALVVGAVAFGGKRRK